MNLSNLLENQHSIFNEVRKFTQIRNYEVYVVGGFVRDLLLKEQSKDIDLVVVGSGIEFAKDLASHLNINKVNYFKNFGTANFIFNDLEIEIVGARKENYERGSRKPIVEEGTLYDDLSRRDFTINAMAISLNHNSFGNLIDNFNGLYDLKNGIIQTPLNPEITFSDDPLRQLRAIRFSTKFNFNIDSNTYFSIKKYANRLNIVSNERIIQELNKILLFKNPQEGLYKLQDTGLLKIFLSELSDLDDVKKINDKSHKNNFLHTITVVNQTRQLTDSLPVLWAALLHDIGKFKTREFKNGGWTFHNHEEVGAKMATTIMQRLKLPIQEWGNKIITIIRYHGKVKELALDETSNIKISDSAIRRLMYEVGEHLDDLLLFAKCDITTKNKEKREKYLNQYAHLEKRIIEIDEKDKIRNFVMPITGEEIMKTFNLTPSKPVGLIKDAIKNAILDGIIKNDQEEARNYMFECAKNILV